MTEIGSPEINPQIDVKNWPNNRDQEISLLNNIVLRSEQYPSLNHILPPPPQELVKSLREEARREYKAPIQLALERMMLGHSIFKVWAAIAAVDNLPEPTAAAMMAIACRYRREFLDIAIKEGRKRGHSKETSMIFKRTLQEQGLLANIEHLFQEWAVSNSEKEKKVA